VIIICREGHRCFMVLEQGRPAGIITPHEVKHADDQDHKDVLIFILVVQSMRRVRTSSLTVLRA
jgi:hypothetical protein